MADQWKVPESHDDVSNVPAENDEFRGRSDEAHDRNDDDDFDEDEEEFEEEDDDSATF